MVPVVAVLRGGPDAEHEVSLKTGKTVLDVLGADPVSSHKPLDIFIDRNGVWHVRGIPKDPAQALEGVDVVWNALHGPYGEGGEVQRVLERLTVPFTGSGSFGSRLAINKHTAKSILQQRGVLVPRGMTIAPSPTLDHELAAVFKQYAPPVVVKPADSGSSLGVSLARTVEQLAQAVRDAFRFSSKVIIEEYIQGREATVGVIDQFRDTAVYALPLLGASNFSDSELNALTALAVQVHQELGLRDYSRSDFMVTPRGVYFLEVNTTPKSAEVSLPSFVTHVLSRALARRH